MLFNLPSKKKLTRIATNLAKEQGGVMTSYTVSGGGMLTVYFDRGDEQLYTFIDKIYFKRYDY